MDGGTRRDDAFEAARLNGCTRSVGEAFALPEVLSIVKPYPSSKGAIHTGVATASPDLRNETNETYLALSISELGDVIGAGVVISIAVLLCRGGGT